MMKNLLKSVLTCLGIFVCLTASGATDTVIPSGFTVTEPTPGSAVKEISKISFKASDANYLTLNQNVKVRINGADVNAAGEISGSYRNIVTYTLSNPITAGGEYEIVIPEGAVSWTKYGDSLQSGQFKFSVTIMDDSYTPSEPTIPSGCTVSPAQGSELESISEIEITINYMDIVADASNTIKVDGNDVNVSVAVSGTFSDVLTITLDSPVTTPGEHSVFIPSGFFKYNTYTASNIESDVFYITYTIQGEVKDDPVPETPVIPNNFTVMPAPGSEVESISEIIISSMLYEGMEVYAGKTISIDGKDVAITSKILDNWGSELSITLENPIVTNGVHTVVIPAGTFKYAQMFGPSSDNQEFKYTLVVANDTPVDPDPETPKIITEQPAGELKTYDRGGSYYYNYDGYLRTGAQTGTVDIVFADDNKVYIKDPINNMNLGSWIVGTLNEEGNTITVELGQYLYEDPEYGYVTIQMVEYDDDYEWFDPISTKEVTYTVDGDVITLNGTYRKGKCLGVVWEEYNEWAGNADYGTIYTPVVEIDQVVVPDDITINTYLFKGLGYGGSELEYTVNVAFDENDMYIQGIFTDTPNAWIKGSVEGDKVTFKSPQYLGKASYGNRSDLFMVATALENTYDIVDMVLTYDEEEACYTNDSQYLVLNTAKNTVYMVEAISYFSLNKVSDSGVYTIPYSDSFGSNASLNNYTIIDANNDGSTWYFSRDKMAYDYSPNAADDWLITPAIELESGHTYVFSLNARSFASMYPERFEVKFGDAATAEAMTVTVIEPTVVASDTMAPFSGKVTVEEGGNYYFGIHAISDPDEFTLYIDDIYIDDEDTLGVTDINADSKISDGKIYSIDGKVVSTDGNTSNLAPGIYIINGRKVLVK